MFAASPYLAINYERKTTSGLRIKSAEVGMCIFERQEYAVDGLVSGEGRGLWPVSEKNVLSGNNGRS